MPDPLPPMCPECGRRPQDSTHNVVTEWREQEQVSCPVCVHRWTRARRPVQGRCAGCGLRTEALKDDLCTRCRANGIHAMSLFDPIAQMVDQAVTDYLDEALGLTVTPPAHDERTPPPPTAEGGPRA